MAAKTLEQHARSRLVAERAAAAAHPDLPVEFIAWLGRDRSPRVRAAVAARTDLRADVAEELSRDPHRDVRAALTVATSKTGWPRRLVPRKPLRRALLPADDPHVVLAASAALTEEQMRAWLTHQRWRVRRTIAERPALPRFAHAFLLTDPVANVRAAAIRTHGAPRLVLADFAQDDHVLVRAAVASRPEVVSIPADVAFALATDPEPLVEEAARRGDPARWPPSGQAYLALTRR